MEVKDYWGFIKDPVYGYIHLSGTEKNIIDTKPLQRLRRIKQLAGAEYVYPAANHTRFEHVLGCMYLAGVLSSSLPSDLTADEKQELKLAALLHDVGHAPFSHLFEPLLMKYLGKNHEDMSTWIIGESELAEVLSREGFDPKRLGKLAIGKLENPRQPYFNQFIRSSVDVDKMDFVVRDSYHTGAGYGFVDVFRLIYTMDTLEGDLAVNITALPTLESFILSRLESFRTIYFHKVSRAAQIMILHALEYAKDDLGISGLKSIDDYLAMDDFVVWTILTNNKKARPIMLDVARRNLLKCAYERVLFVKDEMLSSVITTDDVRSVMEDKIASKAGIAREHVIIDVPTLPSVPYHYAIEISPMDIPIFSKAKNGEKVRHKIGELSSLVTTLMAYMNIVRVYTTAEYREKVSEAAGSVFGESPLSSVVSY